MMTSAEKWREHHRLMVEGRDVTYFRGNRWSITRYRWWHRFVPRRGHFKPFRVVGRPLTADDLTRLIGDPFRDEGKR